MITPPPFLPVDYFTEELFWIFGIKHEFITIIGINIIYSISLN